MPQEKDRILIECFVTPLIANEAIIGKKFVLRDEVEQDLQKIPDMVKDSENIYINRIQKYFNNDAWTEVLRLVDDKSKQLYVCTVCEECCVSETSAVSCVRCLRKTHSTCVFVKGVQKREQTIFVLLARSNFAIENVFERRKYLKMDFLLVSNKSCVH